MPSFGSRFWTIIFLTIVVAVVVLLSSGLSEIQFRPGRPFFLEGGTESPKVEELSFRTWSLVGLWKIFGIVLLWVLFPLSLVYFIVSPEVRKTVIRRALTLGVGAYALFILLRQCGRITQGEVFDFRSLGGSNLGGQGSLGGVFSPSSESWMLWLVNLLFLGMLTVGIGYLLRKWGPRPTPLEQLGQEAGHALEQVNAGADLENVVLRCYAEMVAVVSRARGIQRDAAMTPREFEVELGHTGLPADQVRRLTRLFERVRYGDFEPDERERREALACLRAIVQASEKT